MSHFSLSDLLADVHRDTHADIPLVDVPTFADTLPDGRSAIVAGDVAQDRTLHHEQGQNIFGFQSDCFRGA